MNEHLLLSSTREPSPFERASAGSCSFSFADGHGEVHKWLSGASRCPVIFSGAISTKPFDAAGRLDYQWYKDRTGYTLFG